MMKKHFIFTAILSVIMLPGFLTAQTTSGGTLPYTHLNLSKNQLDPRSGTPIELNYGGPDGYAYKWIDSNEPDGPVYNWIDAMTYGIDTGIYDDDNTALINIGFTFQFYGNAYSQVSVSSNGLLAFNSASATSYQNQAIPDATDPNDFIAPFWDDLSTANAGNIYYMTTGTAPNRQFIVEWYMVPVLNDTGSGLTFEVVLSESDNSILIQYGTMNSTYGDGSQATIGTEDSYGTDGLQVGFNTSYVTSGLAVRITSDALIPPATPANPTAAAGYQQATLSWNANTESDLYKYNIYRNTFSPATTLIDSVFASSTPDTSYVDTGLTPGQPYYYRITAVDNYHNESNFSNEVNAVPLTALQSDSLALVAFFNATNGSGWLSATNWLTASPLSTWQGITVSGGRVTGLNLPNNNLTGNIPADIRDLTALGTFVVNDNHLTGDLPAEIWGLSSLGELNVKNNQLTGSLPADIGNLVNLATLELSGNQFSGPLPAALFSLTGLTNLSLQDNQFSGTISTSLGNLVNLSYLYLGNNDFSGDLPTTIQNCTNLVELVINANQFGSLPDLSPLTALQTLAVENNQLTFGSLENNMGVPSVSFTYSPQDSVGSAVDTTAFEGETVTLSTSVDGTNNQYQWYHDGAPISGATGTSYTLSAAAAGDGGVYTCSIINSVVTGLTLWRQPIVVSVQTVPANTASLYIRGGGTARALDNSPTNSAANPAAYQITGYNLTVEAWVFLMGLPGLGHGYRIVTRPYPNDPYQAFSLYVGNYGSTDDPRFSFTVSDGSTPVTAMDPSAPVTGTWVHVAGTYDGAYLRLYVNGNLVATQPFSQPVGSGQDGFYIGSRYSYNQTYGLIDEVSLWNITRTQSQIQGDMGNAFLGNEAGLMGYWPLNTATPSGIYPGYSVVKDQTTNYNDLLLLDGAKVVNDPSQSSVAVPPEIQARILGGVVGVPFTHTPAVWGWPTPSIGLMQAPGGMGISGNAPGDSVAWTPSDWQYEWNQFVLQANNSSGSVTDTFRVWVDTTPMQTSEHTTGVTQLTVFNNGVIGKMGDLAGSGFLYNGENGLYEGSLVIGQSANQVSGALYSREFGSLKPIRSATNYLSGFDEAYATEFYDGRAKNPIGITVRQRSYSSSSTPNQSFVILEYTLINSTSTDLSGIYPGLATDWDVGNYGQNLAGYSSTHRLSYVYDNSGGSTSYFGTVALTGTISGHEMSTNNMPDSILYAGLTTMEPDPTTPAELKGVLGTGPYAIPAGDSVIVAFALVSGGDLNSIQTNADYAMSAYLSSPPRTPENLSAMPGNHQITLTWTPNSEPDLAAYRIYRYTSGGSPYLVNEVSGSPPDTIYTDAGLTNGVTYWYKITAVDGSGNESSFSAEASASPLDISVPPVVKAVWPQYGNAAMISDTLLVLFDRPMDSSTLSANISVSGNIAGSIPVTILTADSIIGIVPNLRFTSMDYVTVRLGSGIQDLWGNMLDGNRDGIADGTSADDYMWSFDITAAGDFDRDRDIDFDDLMLFRTAWFSQPQGTRCELSPFSGSVPNIQVEPDGMLNFGDLMVLARMWNWGTNSLAKPVTDLALAKTPVGTSPLQLTAQWDKSADGWTSLDQQDYTLDLRLNEKRPIAGLSCTIQLDPKVLSYESLTAADSLMSGSHHWLLLKHYDSQTNRLTLNLLNFGGPGETQEKPLTLLGRIKASIVKETTSTLDGWVDVRLEGDSTQNYRRRVQLKVNTTRPGPDEFSLRQNFPNPFSDRTTIQYAVPTSSNIRLMIFDMRGQVVKTFVRGVKAPGYYTELWEGKNEFGARVSSGMYFVVLRTPEKTFREKMVYIK